MRPHLEYGMPACAPNFVADVNRLEQIHRLATRLGLRSLPRRRIRADLIVAFKIFTGLSDMASEHAFLPSTHPGLRENPNEVLQGRSRCRWKGQAFLVRVVKYWNELPAYVVKTPSDNAFKKGLVQFFYRSPSQSPSLTEHSPPPPLSFRLLRSFIFLSF